MQFSVGTTPVRIPTEQAPFQGGDLNIQNLAANAVNIQVAPRATLTIGGALGGIQLAPGNSYNFSPSSRNWYVVAESGTAVVAWEVM